MHQAGDPACDPGAGTLGALFQEARLLVNMIRPGRNEGIVHERHRVILPTVEGKVSIYQMRGEMPTSADRQVSTITSAWIDDAAGIQRHQEAVVNELQTSMARSQHDQLHTGVATISDHIKEPERRGRQHILERVFRRSMGPHDVFDAGYDRDEGAV